MYKNIKNLIKIEVSKEFLEKIFCVDGSDDIIDDSLLEDDIVVARIEDEKTGDFLYKLKKI